jgi:hypothetical protein
VFAAVLKQFHEHLQGNHERCTFHSKYECDPAKCDQPNPPCDSRGCDCGLCPADGPRRCFGNAAVKDPACKSTKPWKSTLPPITCPRDVEVMKHEIDGIIQSAHELIVEAVGKVDTCYNERVNKIISDARAKGQRPSAHLYAALTNVGLLRANQTYYVLLMREKDFGNRDDNRIEDEWLWEYHVHRDCATPLTRQALRLGRWRFHGVHGDPTWSRGFHGMCLRQ